jgi:hypothetical protein
MPPLVRVPETSPSSSAGAFSFVLNNNDGQTEAPARPADDGRQHAPPRRAEFNFVRVGLDVFVTQHSQ